MKWNRATLVCTGAVAALVIAGCSGGEPDAGHPAEHQPSATTSAAAAPDAAEHNDGDVMFAQHMIPHHQQAIEMSDIVLAKQGIDPRVTDLATEIKAAQGPEIKQMSDWLAQWGNPAMPPMESGDGHDMGAMSGDAMGMMSGEQMTALKNANGVAASKLYLTGMIAHHEGAIEMARTEITNGTFAPATEMARAIVKTQQAEIDTMKGILETL